MVLTTFILKVRVTTTIASQAVEHRAAFKESRAPTCCKTRQYAVICCAVQASGLCSLCLERLTASLLVLSIAMQKAGKGVMFR